MTDYSQGTAFVDQQFVAINEAKISLLDWGFLHSDATYDVAHVHKGKFFRIDQHLERFYAGMDKLQMRIDYTPVQLQHIMCECVRRSGLTEAYVEIITTRGMPAAGSRDPRTCTNQFFAFAIPFVWIGDKERGMHLIITSKQRIPATSVDPVVKNYHWLDLVMGQFEAYERGGETAAVVDSQGNLKEGPGFNIFAVKNDVLITPAEGVLEGVTRKTTIELAIALGFKVIQGDLSTELAHTSDEMFATSTAGGIIPITKVDHQTLAQGRIGKVTKILQDAYWRLHHQADYSLAIDYSQANES